MWYVRLSPAAVAWRQMRDTGSGGLRDVPLIGSGRRLSPVSLRLWPVAWRRPRDLGAGYSTAVTA
jgi:hypothetical protein